MKPPINIAHNPNKDPSNEEISKYIQTIAQEKKKAPTHQDAIYRRVAGILIGTAIGLGYGLVSQFINPVSLPGINIYQAPFDLWGNIVLLTFSGLLIGFVTAYPANWLRGIISGCITFLLLVESRAWLVLVDLPVVIEGINIGHLILSILAYSFVFIFIIPFMMGLRWAIDVQDEHRQVHCYAWKRIRLPIGLLLIAGFTGYLMLYPPEVIRAITSMNSMIQSGLASTNELDLPTPLQSRNVHSFLVGTTSSYTLQWEDSLLSFDPFWKSSINSDSLGKPMALIARFSSGYSLVCVYPANLFKPACKSYEPIPRLNALRETDSKLDLVNCSQKDIPDANIDGASRYGIRVKWNPTSNSNNPGLLQSPIHQYYRRKG